MGVARPGDRHRTPRLLARSHQTSRGKARMAEQVILRPPSDEAVSLDRDTPAPPLRNRNAKRWCCSFCQAELDESLETTSVSGAHGERSSTSSFCSTYCRDCVLALAALHPSPLASSDFIATRGLLTDRLLDLWRQGKGPDPALVLRAAGAASRGLAATDPV
jgi:hypothetical protein